MSDLWQEQEAVPWVAASKILGTPVQPTGVYPCLCDAEDSDAPAWKVERAMRNRTYVAFCEPYRASKGRWAGKITSRCPCWGRKRADGLPDHCCAYHPDNPAYVSTSVAGIEDAARGPLRSPVRPVETIELPEDSDDPEATIWAPRGAYRRRFTKAECTCTCETPWDAEKVAARMGHHCTGCHRNFASVAAARPHQRWVTDTCKDPRTMRNVDGGSVYRPTTDGAFVVWR